MKFIGGFIAGALVTLFVLFVLGIGSSYEPVQVQAQVHHIEVRGKKGNATVYTGMPKDSVRIVLGKPDDVNFRTYGNTALEDWGYKIKNEYVSDLSVDFEDGKLKAVRQY